MSDAAPPGGFASAADGRVPAALNVEAVLADFRAWLTEFGDTGGLTPRRSPEPPLDLAALVAQFTALRHEVNMQTKASRAAVEALAAKPVAPPENDAERAQVKAIIDAADALALSLKQMERFRDSVGPLVAEATAAPTSPPPGFFARLFGAKPATATPSTTAAEKVRQFAASAADGDAMSLRRVERVLPSFGLEPIAATAFDPELMEVVEVVEVVEGGTPGAVVEVVRAGYRWRGKVFRFAQVKVAR